MKTIVNTEFGDMVKEFMLACDQLPSKDEKQLQDNLNLYVSLIEEETNELNDSNDDLNELDACVDIMWVVIGYMHHMSEKENVNMTNICDIDYLRYFIMNNAKANLVKELQTCIKVLKAHELSDDIKLESCEKMIYLIVSYIYHFKSSWDLNGAFKECHRSNMTKVDANTGKVIRREDGKILKPDTFSPADFSKFVKVV